MSSYYWQLNVCLMNMKCKLNYTFFCCDEFENVVWKLNYLTGQYGFNWQYYSTIHRLKPLLMFYDVLEVSLYIQSTSSQLLLFGTGQKYLLYKTAIKPHFIHPAMTILSANSSKKGKEFSESCLTINEITIDIKANLP